MYKEQEDGDNSNGVERKDSTKIVRNVSATSRMVIPVMGKLKGSGYIHTINTTCVK